jgi:small subunit ribosomal protein S18
MGSRNMEHSGPRRSRHLESVKQIDPRDYDLLRRLTTDHGKIMPSRITGATAKQQRLVKRYIRRARVMGILG